MGKTKNGRIVVTLEPDGIIYCELAGYITGDHVRQSTKETERYVRLLHEKGQKAYLLIDLQHVIEQTSEARSESKRVGKLGLERIAISGASKILIIIGQYIVKVGGMNTYAKFFRTQQQGIAWLKSDKTDASAMRQTRMLIATSVLIITGAAFIGWATDNTVFKSIIPGLNAMNPVNTIIFTALASSMLLFKKEGMSNRRKAFIGTLGIGCIIYGWLIVIRSVGIDIPIDRWLFTSKLSAANGVSPNATLDFLLIGGMIITLLSGQRRVWQQYVFHAFSLMLFITTLSAIIRISFGLEALYGRSFIPIALNTAACFLLLNHGLSTLNKPRPFFAAAWRVSNRYWQPALLLFAIMFLVGFAWQQSRQDLQRNVDASIREDFSKARTTIDDHFTTFQNILRGYKGFIESSEDVNAKEFHSYFTNSQPPEGYASFSSVTFARSIPTNQQGAFIAGMKQQGGSVPQFGSYHIYPASDTTIHYPLTYVEPNAATTAFGFDLSTDESRRKALETARDTGQPTATDIINLNASQGPSAPVRKGFFITIPIYRMAGGAVPETLAERRAKIFGFVNTVFENEKLFAETFKGMPTDGVKYVLSSARDGSIIYTHNPNAAGLETEPKLQEAIEVGGQQWSLAMYTTPGFTVTPLQQSIPALILIGGALMAVLAATLLATQARQRQRALMLATSMTEDLNNERASAVLAKEKDDAILSSIGDAVFAIDKNGYITLFNPAAETSSGYTKDEALGKHYKEVLHFISAKDSKVNDSFITKALQGHIAAMENHTKLIRKDSSEVYVSDSAAPIHDSHDVIVGAIIVFRDVSKEYALDKAKSEFVSLASHQLRTPLSAINWYTEMLLDGTLGDLKKEQESQIKEIYQGNQRMIELVNSLLDASRLDLGRLVNTPVPTDVTDIAHSLEKELLTSISAKHLVFNKKIEKSLPTLYVDPKLLRMIMQNLLSNAVKYTPDKGTVTFTMRTATPQEVAADGITSPGPHLYVSVADNGFGIPAAQQQKIFQKMFRADNVQKLNLQGTGLGLYIAHEVALKLGGSIRFTSEEGKGTTFYVILPFKTKASSLADSNDKIRIP